MNLPERCVAISQQPVVVIGAGPAGLTAAYELSRHGRLPVILESDPQHVGGLSCTVEVEGYRYDLGGHRFFSKNDEVVALWREWLGPDLLEVRRKSRILYRGRLFEYPLRPLNAFLNLGPLETAHCLLSYLKARLTPAGPILSFEDWVVRQFGRRLYEIFFRTYTEKVWGMPCGRISADWAVQRIRGLSLGAALLDALGLRQRRFATLTDRFLYPREGPGMLWATVARQLEGRGCFLRMGERVVRVQRGHPIVVETASGARYPAASLISSMPLGLLVQSLDPPAPEPVLAAARALRHRDFLTVGLRVRGDHLFDDQWLYVHDPDVRAGRIQNYRNWSPAMVPFGDGTGLGVEYFCSQGDSLWSMPDSDLVRLATAEVSRLGLASPDQVEGGTVLRVARAYPVYDEGYRDRVDQIRGFLERELPAVQVVGRNGMHRYNNQDHAMMTGLLAARNLLGGPRYDLWKVNGDAEYIEDGPVGEGRLVPTPLQ